MKLDVTKSTVSALTLGVALSAMSAGAHAQAAAAGSDATLAEVVVTAERRSVSLQRVAIAASALSDQDLEVRGVTNMNSLQNFTPSLSITETGLQRFVNIRGVGQSASLPGLQSGIVFNVDGVFTRSTLNEVPFYDISRVEVLRGPQGTLAGQNATGGAVNVITQAPILGQSAGYADVSYGNFAHATGEAAVNLPVSDQLAFRVAVYGENRDSYFQVINPPGSTSALPPLFTPGDLTRFATRASMLAKPTDDLTLNVRAEYYKRKSDGYVYKPVAGDPSVIFNGVDSAAVTPADRFTIDYDAPGKADLKISRISGQADWQVTDGLQLRSLTSYLDAVSDSIQDQDGNGSTQPLGVGTANVRPFIQSQHIHTMTLTQEVNLITTGVGPLAGVLGAYYYDLRNPNAIVNALIQSSFPQSRTKGYAVFGQGTYAFTDRLKFTAGLRYNRDEGSATQVLTVRAVGAVINASPEYSSSAVTGKASLEYQATPNQFLYATASRGYKSGGTNNPPLPTFGPEYVWNYEAGLKSDLFDSHLRTQVSGFYDEYSSYQVNVFDLSQNTQVIKNGGNAVLYGVEFEAQARFGGLGVDAAVSALHSKFGNTPGGAPFTALDTRFAVGNPSRGPILITGKQLPFAQKLTASVGVQHDLPIWKGTLTPRVQYAYNGGQWSSIFQQTFDYIEARHLIDLRLTYARDHWALTGYMTNAEDNTYVSGKFSGFQYLGAPREYGIKLRYNF